MKSYSNVLFYTNVQDLGAGVALKAKIEKRGSRQLCGCAACVYV